MAKTKKDKKMKKSKKEVRCVGGQTLPARNYWLRLLTPMFGVFRSPSPPRPHGAHRWS